MKYDLSKHHRRSIRLKGYDYAQAGAYFVTICTQNWECLFGEVVDGEMRLNSHGAAVLGAWQDLPNHYPNMAPYGTRPYNTTRPYNATRPDLPSGQGGTADGGIRGAQVRVIDFDDPDNNDWLAVNQFAVVENKHERPACAAKRSVAAGRRPDVVLFVNGLPLAVLELKNATDENATDENATIWSAFQQLQTYRSREAVT